MYLDLYENVILVGDFNMTPENKNLQQLLQTLDFEHLRKKPTRFKVSSSCIDLIVANRKAYFDKKKQIYQKLEYQIFINYQQSVQSKTQILKAPPKRTFCRDYKTFDEKNSFKTNLKSKLI